MPKVLVVDDEEAMRFALSEIMDENGLEVVTAGSTEAALHLIDGVDVVVTDFAMPGKSGLELLDEVRAIDPSIPVIMLTAHGSERIAVQALKRGAYDYITKPVDPDELSHLVANALEHKRARREVARLRENLQEVYPGAELIGKSPAMKKVTELIEDAVSKGATKVVGGEIPDGRGYFIEPTVLGDVPEDARVFHEEIFGPVAPIGGFSSEEEAIAKANDTEYGLVAYVFTRDIKRAIRVCEGLDTGMVGLNQGMVSNAGAPFGGVKQSGIGREGGKEGLEEFLETKYVAVNL